jgi:hypothetical protein
MSENVALRAIVEDVAFINEYIREHTDVLRVDCVAFTKSDIIRVTIVPNTGTGELVHRLRLGGLSLRQALVASLTPLPEAVLGFAREVASR